MVELVIFIMIMVVVKNYLGNNKKRNAQDGDSRYPKNQRTIYQGAGGQAKNPSDSFENSKRTKRKSLEKTMMDILDETKRRGMEEEKKRFETEQRERKEREKREHERKRLELQKRREELKQKKSAAVQKNKKQTIREEKNDAGKRQNTKPGDSPYKEMNPLWLSQEQKYQEQGFQEQKYQESELYVESAAKEGDPCTDSFRLEYYLDPLTAPFYPGNQKKEREESFQLDNYLFPTLAPFYPNTDGYMRELVDENRILGQTYQADQC